MLHRGTFDHATHPSGWLQDPGRPMLTKLFGEEMCEVRHWNRGNEFSHEGEWMTHGDALTLTLTLTLTCRGY